MSDQRLRELERQFRRSGAPEDEAAWLRERYRAVPTFALIGCIHGNLEALRAVLDDVDTRGVQRTLCLGDLVGYGPNPVECVDLVLERCEVTLRGHADEALVTGNLDGWSAIHAARTIRWARRLLLPNKIAPPEVRRRWETLCNLPERHTEGDRTFVHGSPRDPLFEYLLPAELEWATSEATQEKYAEVFGACGRALFVAHTHQPGVITEALVPRTDAQLGYAFTLPPDQKTIVNPGSVGQPRDRDVRASYAIVSGDEVRWHRIDYDVERTVAKMQANPEISEAIARRQLEGI